MAAKERDGKRSKSSQKKTAPQFDTKPRFGELFAEWLVCVARPARRWAWRNRFRAETLWAFLLAIPPWFVGEYFQVNEFANGVRQNWPVVAKALETDAVLALVVAAIWIPGLTVLRNYCARLLNDEPSGWDRAPSVLISQFDAIVGHKETRFRQFLADTRKMQANGICPSSSEIFETITQPNAQLHRLMQGLWQVFYVVLSPLHGTDVILKVNLAVIRDGVLEDFVCHFPANHNIRSSLAQLRDKRSCIMRAVDSGRIQVIESIKDAGKTDNGGFLVTDDARSDEDGALICFPLKLPDPSVAFVMSVFYAQRDAFERKYRHTYRKVLECFGLRLKLEYSLLALKGLSSTEIINNGQRVGSESTA